MIVRTCRRYQRRPVLRGQGRNQLRDQKDHGLHRVQYQPDGTQNQPAADFLISVFTPLPGFTVSHGLNSQKKINAN